MTTEKEIFFATSFSGHVDYDTGLVNDDFRERIDGILTSLRAGGFAVYCAVETDGWKISEMPAGESMALNLKNIEQRPIFLALVDQVGSDGRGVEVAHAYNKGKDVLLATGPGEKLGWVMGELVALGMAKHIEYESPEDLTYTLHEMNS